MRKFVSLPVLAISFAIASPASANAQQNWSFTADGHNWFGKAAPAVSGSNPKIEFRCMAKDVDVDSYLGDPRTVSLFPPEEGTLTVLVSKELNPVAVPAGALVEISIAVDGQILGSSQLVFLQPESAFAARVATTHPMIGAIKRGRVLTLRNLTSGTSLGVALDGSESALEQLEEFCETPRRNFPNLPVLPDVEMAAGAGPTADHLPGGTGVPASGPESGISKPTPSELLDRCKASGPSGHPLSLEVQNRHYVTYSEGNDEIRAIDHPDVEGIIGGDGNDTIFVTGRRNFLDLEGGRGADTIVICGPIALSLQINLASGQGLGGDAKKDTLLLGPEVFLGVPEGFRRQIRIFGFTSGDDSINLLVPPGMELDFSINRSPMASVGPVDFTLHMADTTSTPEATAFHLEPAIGVGSVKTAIVEDPLSSYRRDISCEDPIPGPGAEPEIAGWQNALYSLGPDILRIDSKTQVDDHMLLGGDDTAYVFSSQSVSMGSGSDLAIVCSMDQLGQYLNVGTNDIDADTVVVETGRLQGDSERTLSILGVTNVNDRVVLRVPEGLDVAFEFGGRNAIVGSLRVELGFAQMRPEFTAQPAVFVVERVSDAPAAVENLEPPLDLSSIDCPHPNQARSAAVTVAPGRTASDHFTKGDDTVVLWGVPDRPDSIVTFEGNDSVYLFEPTAGTTIATGAGADLVALCTMTSLLTEITLGEGHLLPDAEADGVILGPDVFLAVPEGFRRKVRIHGVTPENDRLQLRLPPGQSVDRFEFHEPDWLEVTVGKVDLRLSFTRRTTSEIAANSIVSIVSATAFGPPANASPEVRREDPDRINVQCSDVDNGLTWAVPKIIQNAGVNFGVYGDSGETILVKFVPSISGYLAGGGNDVVYVVNPGENAGLDLGAGSDVAAVCSMRELAMSINMGPHDAEPDLVILDRGVFAGVPKGQKRRIILANVVAGSDLIVIRPPDGMNAEFTRLMMGPGYVVGDTEIVAYPSDPGSISDYRSLYRIE